VRRGRDNLASNPGDFPLSFPPPPAETRLDPRAAAELVERIRAGDRAAETRLVEVFSRPILMLLERHTSGRPEAQDLYQDTFRMALDKLRRGELREPERLAGFLASLARNLAIEFYRGVARRRTEADGETLERVASPRSSQLSEMLDAEKKRVVLQLLGELRVERDREILFRFYLAEEDKEIIARDFGIDSLQFNRILHRARQRYKEIVESRAGGLRLVRSATSAIVGVLVALVA
jgi:RNA polymerase sigma-70 factor, ECF subfamily